MTDLDQRDPLRQPLAPGSSSEDAVGSGTPDDGPFAPTRLLVVPRTPGPLREVGRGPRPEDELDQFVDELFGEATTEGPGRFDLLLVGVGAAIGGWALLTAAGSVWLVVGVVVLLLGLALPIRSVLRAYRARAARRARREAGEAGYLLDATDPSTEALARAYGNLRVTAGRSRSDLAGQAVQAAHGALVEVATLLDGRAPVTDAQVAYIKKRTTAIRHAGTALERASKSSVAFPDGADGLEPEEQARRRQEAELVTNAREELESTAGMSAVDQLETVTDLLRPGGPDERT